MPALNFTQQSLLDVNPQVAQIAKVIDPTIVIIGDWNGVDYAAIIATETGHYKQQVLASDITAGNWTNLAADFTAVSTAAGNTPGSIQ